MRHEWKRQERKNAKGQSAWVCAVEGCDSLLYAFEEPYGGVCFGASVRHTAETYPCVHRGEPTGKQVDCGCGGRGTKFDVYACSELVVCTITSTGKNHRIGPDRVAVCLGCERRLLAALTDEDGGTPKQRHEADRARDDGDHDNSEHGDALSLVRQSDHDPRHDAEDSDYEGRVCD
jgi:hypothetical protein